MLSLRNKSIENEIAATCIKTKNSKFGKEDLKATQIKIRRQLANGLTFPKII